MRSARAGRPVNARVTVVPSNSVSAARCAAVVPASSARSSAVPSCTATAPARSAAAIAAPSDSPPAAISGSPVTARTAGSSSSSGRSPGRSTVRCVPRCPPASGPCTTSASIPTASARRASSGEVTVPIWTVPTARSARASSAEGSPKVYETTGTGPASSPAILASQSSRSGAIASGRTTPCFPASGRSRSR
ncbi:hypothetical protein GCM10009639_00570 [Kitasatospora putterlickiae]|uniref:Uncharacterized protein n=1 Tax=Kitasatospora putterlickiae TaxID=221725 RepID=A0ABP4IB49_9ACTN